MTTSAKTKPEKQARTKYRGGETRTFGKDYPSSPFAPNRLFDPALPEDQALRRSMAPWVAKTAMWNLLQRGKGRAHKTVQGPLNKIQKTYLSVSERNTGVRNKATGPHPGYDTASQRKLWGEKIMGAKGEAYRRALADPNRPMSDMTGERVSPLTFNPRTQEYDR